MNKTYAPLLKLEHLCKSYDEVHAVKNVNLEIQTGEIIAVVGPSGCGKSTLLKLIAGFESPDSGEVELNNKKIKDLPPEKRGIGMVFQDYSLFPNMNALQNIVFALHKESSKDKKIHLAKDYLKKLKMQGYEAYMPYQLSGGQQQRVAIARTFASNPNLILLDEPFSSIDEITRAHARVEIRNILREEGFSVIMVTHDCKEAMSFADKICLMNEGKIIQVGIPEDLYFKPRNAFVATFMATSNLIFGKIDNKILECSLGNFDIDEENLEKVRISIRPEELKIYQTNTQNAVCGKIIHKEFTGDAYFYTVRVNEDTFIVKCTAYEKFEINQEVYIKIISNNSLIVLKE